MKKKIKAVLALVNAGLGLTGLWATPLPSNTPSLAEALSAEQIVLNLIWINPSLSPEILPQQILADETEQLFPDFEPEEAHYILGYERLLEWAEQLQCTVCLWYDSAQVLPQSHCLPELPIAPQTPMKKGGNGRTAGNAAPTMDPSLPILSGQTSKKHSLLRRLFQRFKRPTGARHGTPQAVRPSLALSQPTPAFSNSEDLTPEGRFYKKLQAAADCMLEPSLASKVQLQDIRQLEWVKTYPHFFGPRTPRECQLKVLPLIIACDSLSQKLNHSEWVRYFIYTDFWVSPHRSLPSPSLNTLFTPKNYELLKNYSWLLGKQISDEGPRYEAGLQVWSTSQPHLIDALKLSLQVALTQEHPHEIHYNANHGRYGALVGGCPFPDYTALMALFCYLKGTFQADVLASDLAHLDLFKQWLAREESARGNLPFSPEALWAEVQQIAPSYTAKPQKNPKRHCLFPVGNIVPLGDDGYPCPKQIPSSNATPLRGPSQTLRHHRALPLTATAL